MSPKNYKHHHFNISLVDKLWNLKRLCEAEFKIHIPLNMVLKDDDYRAELLAQSTLSDNAELVQLAIDIRQLEEDLSRGHQEDDLLKDKKKLRFRFRIHWVTAIALGIILFSTGYMLRSFLPMEAGEVFVFKAVQTAKIESRLNVQSSAVSSSTLKKSEQPLFRIHGSNTIGEKLAPRLIEAYLIYHGAKNVHTDVGQNSVDKIISGEVNGRIEFVELSAHGSATAFTDFAKDLSDVGMASRKIKEQERNDLLATKGDLAAAGSEQVIGLDGLAIIVAPTNNEISNLSIDQLEDIFSGKITNWSELGGKNLPIKVYARDEKSGTWDTFKNLVLEKKKAELVASATRIESSSELSDSVSREAGAIGFIGLPYVRHSKLIAISASANNRAIMPTHFTVGTEDYPLSRRLYFYIPQINSSIEAAEFSRFVSTERAQSIVEDVGFISQNIKVGKPFENEFYPPEMRELTARSERLSINFRFKSGSDELDSKSLSDLDRVAKYVEVNAPKRVQLFGFSDGEGDKEKSKALSERRAKVVEQQLIQRGIFPLIVKGVGDEAPLASSDTEAGKNMNRRVEVWIL